MNSYPFGKPIEITMNGDPNKDVVKIGDETVPRLKSINVDSDLEETVIGLEMVHLPSGGTISISGYIIDDADFELLKKAKEMGLRRA